MRDPNFRIIDWLRDLRRLFNRFGLRNFFHTERDQRKSPSSIEQIFRDFCAFCHHLQFFRMFSGKLGLFGDLRIAQNDLLCVSLGELFLDENVIEQSDFLHQAGDPRDEGRNR